MPQNESFLDRLIERLDRLDPTSVQGYVLKLFREKGLLETVFQTLREGILIVDQQLHLHYVNNAAVKMLGIPADPHERDDLQIGRLLRGVDWSRLMAADPGEWDRVSRQEIEVFYPQHRFIQFYILPYADELQDVTMFTITLHDVTELREKTASAIESERINAITMLAAGVAHEIGNPLNSLTIHLQLLERQLRQLPAAELGELGDLLAVSLQEVRRLDTIINQFLNAVRPVPVSLQPLSLKQVVSSSVAFMRQEIEDRGIFVEVEWRDALPKVMGDENQLKQAFYNIIKNALQAMEPGGVLKISGSANDVSAVLRFADSGRGISPEELGHVFDPYFTTKSEGTGLGLVIVQRILREHGAEFGIDSEPGHGTAITVRFPLASRRLRLLDQANPARPDGAADQPDPATV